MRIVACFPARRADEKGVARQTRDDRCTFGSREEGLEDPQGPGAGGDDETGAGDIGSMGGVGGGSDADGGEDAVGGFGDGDGTGWLVEVDAPGE